MDLAGVVLAGGASSRMGRDKAALVYAGRPQLQRAVALLEGFGLTVRVSIRPDQVGRSALASLKLLEDAAGYTGPAAGLAASWQVDPGRAQLLLAVDLPYVDAEMIGMLLRRRDRGKAATAFVHADGTLEPLCTIWEPAAWPLLEVAARGSGPSLRGILEAADVERLEPPSSFKLESVNTPAEYRAAVERLAGR